MFWPFIDHAHGKMEHPTLSNEVIHPINYEESLAGEGILPPLYEELGVLHTSGNRNLEESQIVWRRQLEDTLYGTVPPPPEEITVERQMMEDEEAELITIHMRVGARTLTEHAALWLPANRNGPVPLICGLEFLGPIGMLMSDSYPMEEAAMINPRPIWGAADGRLNPQLRGTLSHHWPVKLMLEAGYGSLMSCYGSWVPDDAASWTQHGVHPLVGEQANRTAPMAFSLWAWAIMRLLDAAEEIPEVDMSRVAVAGHSRLGKAALWAAANDERIAAVFANSSGCGGAALRKRHFGETIPHMTSRFPHWLLPYEQQEDSTREFLDQHHLLASIAPRAVYLSGADDDLWADPRGCYQALRAAAPAWGEDQPTFPAPEENFLTPHSLAAGSLGWHLRSGGHDWLPFDWRHFLAFLAAHFR